jgi:membrane protein YqaA with SNARE-associated domain
MCLAKPKRAWWLATYTTGASVLGAYLGYLIGFLFTPLARYIVGAKNIDNLMAQLNTPRGAIALVVAAILVSPFKLVTITAGFAHMNLVVFTLACILGRAKRFFIVPVLMWLVGPKLVPLVDKYFNLVCVLVLLVLVAVVVAMKYLHGHQG